jgi:hypothetical protein
MRTSFVASIAVVLAMASTAPTGVNGDATITQPAVTIGPPKVVIPNPPLFITPPRLGFYGGVETPYDIVFAYDIYYLYYGKLLVPGSRLTRGPG